MWTVNNYLTYDSYSHLIKSVIDKSHLRQSWSSLLILQIQGCCTCRGLHQIWRHFGWSTWSCFQRGCRIYRNSRRQRRNSVGVGRAESRLLPSSQDQLDSPRSHCLLMKSKDVTQKWQCAWSSETLLLTSDGDVDGFASVAACRFTPVLSALWCVGVLNGARTGRRLKRTAAYCLACHDLSHHSKCIRAAEALACERDGLVLEELKLWRDNAREHSGTWEQWRTTGWLVRSNYTQLFKMFTTLWIKQCILCITIGVFNFCILEINPQGNRMYRI